MVTTAQPSLKALWERLVLNVSVPQLVLAALALALADQLYPHAGDGFKGALCDETAHVLTAWLVLNLLPLRVRRPILLPALLASFLIDLDHVPAVIFHSDVITAGTQRPYTHSLATIVVALALAAWPRTRAAFVGIAAGLVLHFFRDLAENDAGVSLLWPYSERSFHFAHPTYDTIMGVVVIANFLALWLSARRS